MIAATLTKSLSCDTTRRLANIGQLRGREVVVLGHRDDVVPSFAHEPAPESYVDACTQYAAVRSPRDGRDLTRGLAAKQDCEASAGCSSGASDEPNCAPPDRRLETAVVTLKAAPFFVSHAIAKSATHLFQPQQTCID